MYGESTSLMVSSRRALLSSMAVGVPALFGGCVTGGDSVVAVEGDVPESVRRRCRRAARRTLEIVDGSLEGPVQITFVSPRETGDRGPSPDAFTREIRRAQHVTGDATTASVRRLARAFHATYDGGERTISFVDPSSPLLEDAMATFASEDVPPIEAWYPPGSVVAHELTHAVQRDRFDAIPAADTTTDAASARQAVVEGTASYVADRYRGACRNGEYESCAQRPVSLAELRRDPVVVARRRQQYVNGSAFAGVLHEAGGWDAIWRVHESPPATTFDTTYPERYLNGATTPESVSALETGRNWIRMDEDRLGVAGVYAKLFALGVTSLPDQLASSTSDSTSAVAYRSPLLESWVGDRFVAYGHVDESDRTGHVWRIRLRSADDASALARAVERGYDRRGDPVDVGWRLGDRYVTVEVTGDAVAFWMAPSASGLEDLQS